MIELRFAPERSGAWLWPLPLACYLLVSSIPYFRLRPPEDELARQRMKEAEAEKVKQAAEDKAHMEEAAKEQEAFMIEHEKMLAEQERLRQMDEEPMEMHQVGNPPTPHVDGVLVN